MVFIQGALTVANLLVSLFVLIFAILFLARTKSVRARQPWIFLMIAVIVFFIMQLFNTLVILEVAHIEGYQFIFDSMLIAILLFTFIFQYNLILNSELITIASSKHPKR